MTQVRNSQSWKKKILEKKRVNKAATLRKYAKLCKSEGIQSNRVRLDKNKIDESGRDSNTHRPAKPAKSSAKLEKIAAEVQEEKVRHQEEHKREQIKLIEEALKKKKEKRKIMTAKNSKGQPLFKGRILNILERLTK